MPRLVMAECPSCRPGASRDASGRLSGVRPVVGQLRVDVGEQRRVERRILTHQGPLVAGVQALVAQPARQPVCPGQFALRTFLQRVGWKPLRWIQYRRDGD